MNSDYHKNYYQEHKEKYKNYWVGHKEEKKVANERYRQTHHEQIRADAKRFYAEHRDQIRAASKAYQGRVKAKIINHYSNGSNKCARCGIDDVDVLCIDHINGNGNVHRRSLGIKSGYNFYRWLVNNNYPAGFQVLCWNCNAKKLIKEGV